MLNAAVLLIALGAVVGLYMAVQHFKGRTPPKAGVAILHGLLAGTGVILLLLVAWELGFDTMHAWALGLFVVAFFMKHVRGTAALAGGLVAQALIVVLFFVSDLGFLWFNVIACVAVMLVSSIVQAVLADKKR